MRLNFCPLVYPIIFKTILFEYFLTSLYFSGCIGFMGIAVYFLIRASDEVKVPEKLVFMLYFAGTIICLGLSSAFHTLHCHSEWVGKLFNKCVQNIIFCGLIHVYYFQNDFLAEFALYPSYKKICSWPYHLTCATYR